MSNRVTASLVFSFKGKTHKSSLELDLDQYMQDDGQLPDLYPLIATANNFDLYSYEFEMMQAEPIVFSNASGLIKDFIVDGKLDVKAFESAWQEHRLLQQLETITQQYLSNAKLEQQPDLKAALLAAYQLGQKNPK